MFLAIIITAAVSLLVGYFIGSNNPTSSVIAKIKADATKAVGKI